MIDNFKKINSVFIALFFIGAWVRSIDVLKPLDRTNWHECDYASIARNYCREGMNIFYPRIDWRGDGPGYAEMEFPIFPWSVAILYKIFGYNELFGRFLAYFFSLLTLLVFFQLARYLLEPLSAVISSFFFVFNPMVVGLSNSLQPEGLMLLFYILAAYAFMRWLDEEKWIWYVTALGSTTMAILVKVSSAHIGLFFLGLLLSQKGFKNLWKIKLWAFGIFVLFPSLVWYLHAHRFWLIYGNSLGVSNEYHWIGWDLFIRPSYLIRLIKGAAKIEITYIWMPLGWIAALISIWLRRADRVVRISFLWLTSIFIYYLVAIRTTADLGAAYYHVVSVPPAALLIGAGACLVAKRAGKGKLLVISLGLSLGISMAMIFGRYFLDLNYPRYRISGSMLLLFAAGIAAVPFLNIFRAKRNMFSSSIRIKESIFLSYLLLFIISSTFCFQGFLISIGLHPKESPKKYECAQLFKPLIPENTLIIASGLSSKDWTGRPVAYNNPYMFYWLDRKGFNISEEEQSIDVINFYINRGAHYFVLEKQHINPNSKFMEELEQQFTLLKECSETYLFKLTKAEK